MVIELTNEELELVRELIDERVAQLGPEIHHTDSRDFRDGLQALRKKLWTLGERLVAPTR